MSSSWTPFYNGQPPIGFRNGRPFYNQVSPNAQRPPIPIKENLKNGSRGQILAGSAPESSPPSFETQRRQQGALEFPYGDRPPNFARAQTAPVENRSDFPRREPYLPGTQMNNEYRNYKNADSQAGQASTAYKNGVKQAKRNGRPSGTENKPSGKGVSLYSEGHRTVAPLAESASSKAQSHYEERKRFNEGHIGRVPRSTFKNHASAQKDAKDSWKNYQRKADTHRELSGRRQ